MGEEEIKRSEAPLVPRFFYNNYQFLFNSSFAYLLQAVWAFLY